MITLVLLYIKKSKKKKKKKPRKCIRFLILNSAVLFPPQGQFNFAEVVIKPLDNVSNMVTLRFKDELKDLLTDSGPRVISDANLPRLVRQLVVHINVSSKSILY